MNPFFWILDAFSIHTLIHCTLFTLRYRQVPDRSSSPKTSKTLAIALFPTCLKRQPAILAIDLCFLARGNRSAMSLRLWCSRIWAVTRYIFSTALLFFGLTIVLRAIILGRTRFWDSVPWPVVMAIFVTLLIALGTLEGLQVAIVELAKIPPESYRQTHERAYNIALLCQKHHVLEHFLMGRQFLVVMIVFFLARITTLHDPWLPQWLNEYFCKTGLLGAILVVLIGNLPAQIYAADFPNPLRWNQIPGMNLVLYACLLIEWTGITHAAWLLPWAYIGLEKLCKRMCCSPSSSTFSDTTLSAENEADELSSLRTDPERVYVLPFPRTVQSLLSSRPQLRDEALEVASYARYFARYKLARPANPQQQQQGSIIAPFNATPEEFHNHPSSVDGQLEFAAPAEIIAHLQSAGLQAPRFLLPVDDPRHIPPHIVACRLLASIDLLLNVRYLQGTPSNPHLSSARALDGNV